MRTTNLKLTLVRYTSTKPNRIDRTRPVSAEVSKPSDIWVNDSDTLLSPYEKSALRLNKRSTNPINRNDSFSRVVKKNLFKLPFTGETLDLTALRSLV